ncbi:MAG: alpha/beta hydrolase [Lachnospiraceae bacterium]|nr:alpha/beta hydrolase [Lachnospiraceae bacterium]
MQKYIKVNNIKLFYTCTGSGAPLIMLHGNGEDHSIFNEAVALLTKHFTVYSIDARDHGQSDKVDELHYDDMAEDIRIFIEELGLEKPILYGFSDGGIIGLLLAIKYPELLSKVIGSGVNVNPEGLVKGWYIIFKIIYFFNRDRKFKLMLTEPNITKEMLSKIRIPVFLTGGSKDMIRQEHMRMIAENIPGAKLSILEGEKHGSYIVHNQKIAEVIIEYCECGKQTE